MAQHPLSDQRKVRSTVRARAGGQCELCDIPISSERLADDPQHASLHHRFPRRSGGRDEVSNLIHLCRKCHTETVHRDEQTALNNGWMCNDRMTANAPVYTRSGWVYLTPAGSYEPLTWLEISAISQSVCA